MTVEPEQNLASSAQQDATAALVEGSQAVGVWDWDGHDFMPVWVNDAFTKRTGYTLAQAREYGPALLAAEHRPLVAELYQSTDSAPVLTTLSIRTATAEILDVPVSITVRLHPENGKPFRLIAAERTVELDLDDGADPSSPRRALELVMRISEILADFDEPKALEAIARILKRRLGMWCWFLVDDGVLHLADDINEHVRVRRTNPDRAPNVPQDQDPVAGLLAGRAISSVKLDLDATQVHGSQTAQLIELIRQDAGEVQLAGHVQVLPLMGRGRALGLMALVPLDLHIGGEDERQTIVELCARRVGMALENAHLHFGEHTMVEALQRAMLPELDQIDSLDVWTYYAPSSTHAQVGGDWYDVVRLEEDVIALVVGDVTGHDIEAAAAMGQLRSVVRAFAADLHEPDEVLTRVDRIVDSMRMGKVASLIYATLTQSEDQSPSWELRYSRAGHLPGLLVRGGEVRQLDGAGGHLIGFGAVERQTAVERLQPGDVLVMYTDGLIERRDRPTPRGLDELQKVLTGLDPTDAASVGELLLRELAESPEDDVAVVVTRVPEPSAGNVGSTRRRHWKFPAAKESVRLARRAASATSRSWEVASSSAVEIVVSELVANAVMHAWGTVGLSLVDTGEGIRVEVEDDNPMPPTPAEMHPSRVGGYGMHIVARLADWGWRPSGAGKVVWARIDENLAADLGAVRRGR